MKTYGEVATSYKTRKGAENHIARQDFSDVPGVGQEVREADGKFDVVWTYEKSTVDLVNANAPEGFKAYENIDLGPTAIRVHTPVEGHDFSFAVGFNVEGWEAVLDLEGTPVVIPDGPGADADEQEVAEWIAELLVSYVERGEQTPDEWGTALFEAAEEVNVDTYKIVRFYKDDRPNEVQQTGLSLEDAQAHCKDDSTHGDDWFDGYEKEE